MQSDPEHVNERYFLQAQWSRPLREYIYRKLPAKQLHILEVGSGTGAIIRNISGEIQDKIGFIAGIDLDHEMSAYSCRHSRGCFCTGAGEDLPFASSCFDFVFCHYLLLWIQDPVKVLTEMRRVTLPGGICAAMAEPCYSEMAASPKSFMDLAEKQREYLIARGMNIKTGRKLEEYFRSVGFSSIESAQYDKCEMDIDYLKTEICQMAEDTGIKNSDVRPDPEFEYFVPTYYAIAVK